MATPGGREKSAIAIDGYPGVSGGTGELYIYGGFNGAWELSDLWRFSMSLKQWSMPFEGSSSPSYSGTINPGRRSAAGLAVQSGNVVWLFGGASGSGLRNDLFKWNGSSWSFVKGSTSANQKGTYGTKGNAASGNVPGARNYFSPSIPTNSARTKLYLYGGIGYDSASTQGPLGDFWSYSFSTNMWTWEAGSNTVKENAVYGTQGVGSTSNAPGSRENMAYTVDKDDKLWLFGGYYRGTSTTADKNDVWQYDIATKKWMWVAGSSGACGASNKGTKGVTSASSYAGCNKFMTFVAGASSGQVWLFGGTYNSEDFGALWRFDAPPQVFVTVTNTFTSKPTVTTTKTASTTKMYTLPTSTVSTTKFNTRTAVPSYTTKTNAVKSTSTIPPKTIDVETPLVTFTSSPRVTTTKTATTTKLYTQPKVTVSTTKSTTRTAVPLYTTKTNAVKSTSTIPPNTIDVETPLVTYTSSPRVTTTKTATTTKKYTQPTSTVSTTKFNSWTAVPVYVTSTKLVKSTSTIDGHTVDAETPHVTFTSTRTASATKTVTTTKIHEQDVVTVSTTRYATATLEEVYETETVVARRTDTLPYVTIDMETPLVTHTHTDHVYETATAWKTNMVGWSHVDVTISPTETHTEIPVTHVNTVPVQVYSTIDPEILDHETHHITHTDMEHISQTASIDETIFVTLVAVVETASLQKSVTATPVTITQGASVGVRTTLRPEVVTQTYTHTENVEYIQTKPRETATMTASLTVQLPDVVSTLAVTYYATPMMCSAMPTLAMSTHTVNLYDERACGEKELRECTMTEFMGSTPMTVVISVNLALLALIILPLSLICINSKRSAPLQSESMMNMLPHAGRNQRKAPAQNVNVMYPMLQNSDRNSARYSTAAGPRTQTYQPGSPDVSLGDHVLYAQYSNIQYAPGANEYQGRDAYGSPLNASTGSQYLAQQNGTMGSQYSMAQQMNGSGQPMMEGGLMNGYDMYGTPLISGSLFSGQSGTWGGNLSNMEQQSDSQEDRFPYNQ